MSDFTKVIEEQIAVCCLCKGLFRDCEPLLKTQFSVRGTGCLQKKIARTHYPVSCTSHRCDAGTTEPEEGHREFSIGSFQQKFTASVHKRLVRKKNAESGFKIMVLRNLIIITETFRSASEQPDSKKGEQLRKLLFQHRFAVCFKKSPG